MSLHNFLLFHLRRHVKNSGFVLHHGFQIPRNKWKHSACGLVLSSVSRYLEPVIKHSPSFLTYYLTVVERVHHGLFLGPHHGWIHGEILSLKTWKWWREFVFFRHCHRWAGECAWYGHVRVYWSEWSHSCCDVGNCHLFFLSTGVFIISFGYCTGESSLFFLVGLIVIVKGLYALVACDLHNIWAFNIYFL